MKQQSKAKRVVMEGHEYEWDGQDWCDVKSRVIPPSAIKHKLNAMIMPQLEKEDEQINDVGDLLQRVREAEGTQQYQRAEKILYKILKITPGNISAVSMLCSILRKNNEPARALEVTEPFKNSDNKYLATSRAAAYCDLEQWDKADKEVRRAIAISGGEISEYLDLVMKRIHHARPDIYSRDQEE